MSRTYHCNKKNDPLPSHFQTYTGIDICIKTWCAEKHETDILRFLFCHNYV